MRHHFGIQKSPKTPENFGKSDALPDFGVQSRPYASVVSLVVAYLVGSERIAVAIGGSPVRDGLQTSTQPRTCQLTDEMMNHRALAEKTPMRIFCA